VPRVDGKTLRREFLLALGDQAGGCRFDVPAQTARKGFLVESRRDRIEDFDANGSGVAQE
jgi:hypothetical protein